AEGVKTAYAIEKLAKMKGIYTPIVNEVVAIFKGKSVQEATQNLLKQND
ncbi:glycerol-3-phosphate dehydrogenase, partial [Campylobacter jejuni]|nr:glycerol-3-phosphate dehydrogenase [Campylobacter jejuni]